LKTNGRLAKNSIYSFSKGQSVENTQIKGCKNGIIQVAINGKLDNKQELYQELETRGHRLRANTDTEVIVHAYEEWGERCVERFSGAFALAVWDERSGSLLLARDRIGHKSLFYHKSFEGIAFASHLAPLTEWAGVPKDIDPEAIDAYLTFRAVPAPQSIYRGVRKLPAAHMLSLKNGRFTVKCYWPGDFQQKRRITEREAADQLNALLYDAVQRSIAGRKFGVMLSGGLDSSIILGLSLQAAPQPPQAFSFAFSRLNELERARYNADHFGIKGQEFTIEPRIADILPSVVQLYDEPYGNGSALPYYYFAHSLRERVDVVLSGDGADEVFAGHIRHRAFMAAERLFSNSLGRLVATVGALLSSTGPLSQARMFFKGGQFDALDRHLFWTCTFSTAAKTELYTPEFARQVKKDGSRRVIEQLQKTSPAHPLDQVLALDLALWVPEVMLVLLRSGFSSEGVEARTPFLDYRVIEFAASLPPHLKAGWRSSKVLLRKTFANQLPASPPRKQKVGPKIPVGALLRGELRSWLHDYLLSEQASQRGYFRRDVIRRMVDEHTSGRLDHGQKLWALLMLELWHHRPRETSHKKRFLRDQITVD
jgi:asparagine synthase (glutamine-hydrolysing)